MGGAYVLSFGLAAALKQQKTEEITPDQGASLFLVEAI
jgi:hypothetical protein